MNVIEKRKRINTTLQKEKELETRELEIICFESQLQNQKEKLQNFTNMLENRLHRIVSLLKKGKIGKAIKECYKLLNSLKQSKKDQKIDGMCEFAKIARYMYQYPEASFDEAKLATGSYFGGDLSREDFYAGLREKIEKLREKHMQHYTPEF